MKAKIAIPACVCCVGLLLMVILIPMSINVVEADEIGIAYDNLSEELSLNANGKAYTEGRYVLTPASEFFLYKRTLQTLDYEADPILCLSAEGLQMVLSITIQYQIDQDKVMEILTNYGLEPEWNVFLISVSRDVLKDVCGKYYADDYFYQRANIEQDMLNTTKTFFALTNAYATVELVNLRNVQHPKFFVDANQEKQSIEQEKDRLIRERENLLTQENTALLKAIEEAKVKMINANATARSAIAQATAEIAAIIGRAEAEAPAIIQEANDLAPAENKKWDARGQAFLNIWSQMENTTNDEFIEGYLHYRILTSQGTKPIMSLPLDQAQASVLNLLVAKMQGSSG